MNNTVTVDQYINHENIAALPKSSKNSQRNTIQLGDKRYFFVPAGDCLITNTILPAKNKMDLLAALPYALEEELSEPVETLHFITSDQNPDGTNSVIVTAKKNMQRWLRSLSSPVDIILPDVLALPWEPTTWTIVIDQDRALVRNGIHQGFECELPQLKMQLEFLKRQQKRPKQINVWLPQSKRTLDLPKDCADKIQGYQYKKSFHNWLATSANPVSDLNLLSGEFQENDTSTTGINPWLPVLSLLLLTILFHSTFTWYQTSKINSEIVLLENKINSLFKEAFPETRRVVNPRVQTQQRLNDLRKLSSSQASGNFLNLFFDVITATKQFQGMDVKGLAWKQGQLQMQLMAISVSQVENLESALKAKQYSVEILNAINKDGFFQAQLKIREMEK